MNFPADKHLDTCGSFCPQPILDLAREIKGMRPGEVLEIVSDDVAFPLDLQAWCAGCGHVLLGIHGEGKIHRGWVRKQGGD